MSAEKPMPSYSDAHGVTEEALIRIVGLAHGLYDLATEHPGLNNPEPMSNAILSIIVCLEEKAEAAQKAHEAEHAEHHREKAAVSVEQG